MKFLLSTAMAVLAVTAAVLAQSASDMKSNMDMTMKGDKTSATYTGCVEAWNHGAAFLLTHVTSGPAKPMAGSMDGHTDNAMSMEPATMDAMPSTSMVLSGVSGLSKHVGHKVSVVGSTSRDSMGSQRPNLPTFTVASLKVVAKSCS